MIHLTEKAIRAIKSSLEEENLSPEDTYLRIGVTGGGCSGLSYNLSFEKERAEDDAIVEQGGISLLIDGKSKFFLMGLTLDYTSGLNGKGFVFSNPNAVGTCGCGQSFSA
ncbi:MAG: iron-sulfur cluster assembly accessory protein [Candidatus Latescibacteria bacterium]|nr:iron-sulfur cluster assembly accessory protein [Candidatus Latescibacterota bacterium]NIO00966.1 iron-sulfur cluster assembly accessory protein [Candidatus Latescibacterota bacterium]NIO27365.1 iron-sulfur cluster assembly accessory protein [Candidatus Latescibacterota bacterium]NIO54887.1 iron-sulfur cluster assembly accessory protein [Candidatus Latescibacterota bacterium]NIT00976.1 iron-sulfur cluster assembly accessory protein [Candidatus Latescibacterota bacterium]